MPAARRMWPFLCLTMELKRLSFPRFPLMKSASAPSMLCATMVLIPTRWSAAVIVWAFTLWKRALLSVLPRSFMTVRTPPSPWPPPLTSTGRRFSMVLPGSILPALLPLWAATCPKSAWKLAAQPGSWV